MMDSNAYVVIMAGGKGERLWPLSTNTRPKQLLDVIGGTSLLAQSLARARQLVPPENILIVTNQDLVEPITAAREDLPARNIIGEPMGRDTAAACALGVGVAQAYNPDAAVCILTADHVMGDDDIFCASMRAGIDAARQGMIATIGVKPTFPSTGFGYIELSDEQWESHGESVRKAVRFVEKPDDATARAYLASGHHVWNAGMFVWSAQTFKSVAAAHAPHLVALADGAAAAVAEDRLEAYLTETYPELPRISVDYAIMEHAPNVATVEGRFEWHDVGSLSALAEHLPTDAQHNAAQGRTVVMDAADNLVVGGDRLTALIGVDDLMVVQTATATLICPKSRAQDVKALVHQIGEQPDLLTYL